MCPCGVPISILVSLLNTLQDTMGRTQQTDMFECTVRTIPGTGTVLYGTVYPHFLCARRELLRDSILKTRLITAAEE